MSMMLTTLMFRNLPRRYESEHLLSEVEAAMGSGMVDFVLVPWQASVRNLGYGFVNFRSVHTAATAAKELDGKSWLLAPTAKRMKISPSNVQGLAANVATSDSNARQTPWCATLPIVFLEGRPVEFHEAVQRLVGAEDASARDLPAPQPAEHPPAPLLGAWPSPPLQQRQHAQESPHQQSDLQRAAAAQYESATTPLALEPSQDLMAHAPQRLPDGPPPAQQSWTWQSARPSWQQQGWQLPPLGLIGEAVLTEKASAAQRADVFQPSIAEGSGSLHMAKQPSTADQHIVRARVAEGQRAEHFSSFVGRRAVPAASPASSDDVAASATDILQSSGYLRAWEGVRALTLQLAHASQNNNMVISI